jgi:hypothetical protein
MAKRPVLRLVRERKLAELLEPPRAGAVYEASGVIAIRTQCFVALDNIRRVARIGTHLRLKSDDHRWVGRARHGEGYEAITYSRANRTFYLMIEAQKHPDGTFKGVVEEFDDDWRFKGRKWVDLPFKKRNTAFEGLASVDWRGQQYLLALCEGNGCRDSHTKPKRGQGRIHVLERRGRIWHHVERIKLPKSVKFKDYAGMALRGDRLAVVSQESSRVWIGRLRRGRWAISGKGRVYDLPRTKKGKKRYFTVEGISWLSPRTLVAVSDLSKKRHPKRGAKTDQSIHVFRIPSR